MTWLSEIEKQIEIPPYPRRRMARVIRELVAELKYVNFVCKGVHDSDEIIPLRPTRSSEVRELMNDEEKTDSRKHLEEQSRSHSPTAS